MNSDHRLTCQRQEEALLLTFMPDPEKLLCSINKQTICKKMSFFIQQSIKLLTLELMPGPPRPLVSSYNTQANYRSSAEEASLQNLHLVLSNLWFIEEKRKKKWV